MTKEQFSNATRALLTRAECKRRGVRFLPIQAMRPIFAPAHLDESMVLLGPGSARIPESEAADAAKYFKAQYLRRVVELASTLSSEVI